MQDLLVVTESGPLLFVNQGKGKYSLKRDAFKFARSPQGSFTQAAIADYDRDGRLDIYFCVYNYYVGLDQYLRAHLRDSRRILRQGLELQAARERSDRWTASQPGTVE